MDGIPCKHEVIVDETYVDCDRHGIPYAQHLYSCVDCGLRWPGERIYYGAALPPARGHKEAADKDKVARR